MFRDLHNIGHEVVGEESEPLREIGNAFLLGKTVDELYRTLDDDRRIFLVGKRAEGAVPRLTTRLMKCRVAKSDESGVRAVEVQALPHSRGISQELGG